MRRSFAALLLALSALGSPLTAQAPADSGRRAADGADGSNLTISILTFGQGDPLWERFGHNALRIRDASQGTDVAYNWGTFDFQQPNFVGRFLSGNTLYWLDTAPAAAMIDYYARELNRSGVEQVLALTPAQRAALRDFVTWNVRPENRNYRYDYFVDNCSTRLRDAVDRVLGGELRRQLAAQPSAHTYRSESLRLVDGLHFTQAGMHVALGPPADRPLTAWEEAFVPMRLRDRLRAVRVTGEDGVARPLVASEEVLYTATRAAEAGHTPSLVGRFLVAGLLLAALVAWLGARAARGARRGYAAAGVSWGLLAGVMGLVLALAWAVTRHQFWYWNQNLLQLSPLALALVLLPFALRRARLRRGVWLAVLALLGMSALGLVLALLPGATQRNLAVVLFALPVHAAVAWTLRRIGTAAARSGA